MNAESQSIGINRRIPGNDDECRNDAREFDRGTFDTLTFTRCCRGYTLVANRDYGRRTVTMAFDRIESVACWLVEQYNPNYAEQVKAADAEIEKVHARSRTGRPHQYHKCPGTKDSCHEGRCIYCHGGLAYCDVCCAGEAQLLEHCPGPPRILDRQPR